MRYEQLYLIEPIKESSEGRLWRKFREFHEENPHVYESFERLAIEAYNCGYRKIGAKFLYEKMRWEYMDRTTGRKYKINNDYHPYYARLFMENNPEYKGYFELRSVVV